MWFAIRDSHGRAHLINVDQTTIVSETNTDGLVVIGLRGLADQICVLGGLDDVGAIMRMASKDQKTALSHFHLREALARTKTTEPEPPSNPPNTSIYSE